MSLRQGHQTEWTLSGLERFAHTKTKSTPPSSRTFKAQKTEWIPVEHIKTSQASRAPKIKRAQPRQQVKADPWPSIYVALGTGVVLISINLTLLSLTAVVAISPLF